MKAVFMSCNQSMFDSVLNMMKEMEIKGFTGWEELIGAGSRNGEPHLGDHAWPAMNSALISVMEDKKAEEFLARLKQMDEQSPEQGMRAFAWDVTQMI